MGACASLTGCSSSADDLDGATVVPQRSYRVMLQGPVPMGREPLGGIVVTPENAPRPDAPVVGGPTDPSLGRPAAPVPAPVAPGPIVPLPPGAPPPGPGTGPGAGTRPEGAAPPPELPDVPSPRGSKVTRNPFSPPGTPGALRKVRPPVVAPGTPLAGPVPSGRAPLRQAPVRAVRVGPVAVVPGSTRGLPVGPPTRPAAPVLVVLGPGSSGEGVREVQQRLAADGWRGRVDGVFGPQTRLEVQSFQRRRGLVVDGIVGRETWAALRSREAQP